MSSKSDISFNCEQQCESYYTENQQTVMSNNIMGKFYYNTTVWLDLELKAQFCEFGTQIKEQMDVTCLAYAKQDSTMVNEVLMEYASANMAWVIGTI